MSRYHSRSTQNQAVVYGFDHACGYFLQVYEDDDDELIADVDSLFDKLTGAKLAQRLEELGAAVPPEHVEAMALDLEF